MGENLRGTVELVKMAVGNIIADVSEELGSAFYAIKDKITGTLGKAENSNPVQQ